MTSAARLFFLVLLYGLCAPLALPGEQPNLLLITVDDMNADSVGVFGSAVPGATPHIDQLAREGMRFEMAHVQVANCMPSRNVMWSGRYPHSNGIEGFVRIREPGYPLLPDLLQEAGYFTAIRHKVRDSTPYTPYIWDLVLDAAADGTRHHPRDPASYGLSTREGIGAAKAAGKPFAILVNIGDPHVPFYGMNKAMEAIDDPNKPSRSYAAEEVAVPGFLFDDPVVRRELAAYYSSVRRADDAVGHVLKALDAAGATDSTLVMFLSDHGMPFPFAKTQLYHHSTRTPLVFRWPSTVKADTADTTHMVSAVDLLPTLLEAVGATAPRGLQGRSFLDLLQGGKQDDRGYVFKEYNENSAGQRAPMRAVQTPQFLYIFNAWSDGKRVLRSATRSTGTHARMAALAEEDAAVARRLQLLEHRVPEELYDVVADPDCLVNLIDEPAYSPVVQELTAALEAHLRRTDDHALPALVGRGDPAALAGYMREQHKAKREQRDYIEAIKASMNKDAKKTKGAGASVEQGH